VPALGRLERRQVGEGMADTLGTLSASTLTGRGHPPTARARVVIEFSLERSDMGLGLCKEALERRPAAVRGRSGSGADADAVLSNRSQGHKAVGEERCDALCQEPIENVGVLDPEGGKGVVVETDAADEPAVRVVLSAQPIERPGRRLARVPWNLS